MNINQADQLSIIALNVVRELRDELQDGELDAAIAAMDAEDTEKRKVVPKKEFCGTEDVPAYETEKPNYER